MFALQILSKPVSSALIAFGSLAIALPAVAVPIDWAEWSAPVTGTTTGSATATFATAGLSAAYSGELQQFVANYPSYQPAGTFSGGNVDNAPAQADGIIRIIGGSNTGTNTITFSQAVLNPVLAIWSLGQGGINAQFAFGQPFTIQSGGPSNEYGGPSITAVGNTVFGSEGNGVIQFSGLFNSISWTNPVAEDWYGFTVGTPVNPIPEPETYALMLAGLAALGAAARRRRKSA